MNLITFLLVAFCCIQAHAYPLPQKLIKTYQCKECAKLPRNPLQANWALTKTSSLHSNLKVKSKSYSYSELVTAKQLQKGVAISTHAPRAVISITPLQQNSMPKLEFITSQKRTVGLKEVSSLYAQDHALEEFSTEHQTIIQVKPKFGYGTLIMKSTLDTSNEANTYLLHVFDKYSLIYLQIEIDSLHYHYGDQFVAKISIQDPGNSYSIEDLSTELIGPDGQILPLNITELNPNQFEVSTTLTSELNTHGENWYIEAELIGMKKSGVTRRTVRAAFSYSLPSASILHLKKIASSPLTFVAILDVATASRYALQSVLFHQDTLTGKQLPVETCQSAQWLEPGIQKIKFSFDNSTRLEDDTLSVGYFRLTDYGQLKTVYHYDHLIKLSELMD
jgi:hypothetical protein